MLPLYHDQEFTFRFSADRIISRFHLEGVDGASADGLGHHVLLSALGTDDAPDLAWFLKEQFTHSGA